jgi:hypothetical protein
MKFIHLKSFIISSLLLFSLTALADTLVLKDGRVLQGTFKGGTAEALQFEVEGKIETVALGDITSLTFTPREAASQPAPTADAAAGAATMDATGPVTLPAGSK